VGLFNNFLLFPLSLFDYPFLELFKTDIALVQGFKKEPGQIESFSDVAFVIDSFEVSYGPSSPVLVELAELGARKKGGRILVLADPLYPSEKENGGEKEKKKGVSSLLDPGRSMPSPDQLSRLVKTRHEALAIGRMLLKLDPQDPQGAASLMRLADERSGTLSGKWFDLYLGKDASPNRLRKSLNEVVLYIFSPNNYS